MLPQSMRRACPHHFGIATGSGARSGNTPVPPARCLPGRHRGIGSCRPPPGQATRATRRHTRYAKRSAALRSVHRLEDPVPFAAFARRVRAPCSIRDARRASPPASSWRGLPSSPGAGPKSALDPRHRKRRRRRTGCSQRTAWRTNVARGTLGGWGRRTEARGTSSSRATMRRGTVALAARTAQA